LILGLQRPFPADEATPRTQVFVVKTIHALISLPHPRRRFWGAR
jgi:hypothetical protein